MGMDEKQREDLELRLASTLAPMLLTVAIFSLTLVGNIATSNGTIVDEVLCLLSAACILGAAMVADSALDMADLSFANRFQFLGGGYFLFCVVAGVISFVIPLLYVFKSHNGVTLATWQYLVYGFTALSVVFKLMQNKEKSWTVGMFVLSAASVIVTSSL
jgi:hypothetical protein